MGHIVILSDVLILSLQAVFNDTEEFVLSIDEPSNEVCAASCVFSVTIWASIEESWVVADCNLGCSDGRKSSKVAFQSYWCTPLA